MITRKNTKTKSRIVFNSFNFIIQNNYFKKFQQLHCYSGIYK